MLKFVKAAEVAAGTGLTLRKPNGGLTGEMLGTLTMLTINRFLDAVEWEDIAVLYLTGLASDEDIALMGRAIRALMEGGVEIA